MELFNSPSVVVVGQDEKTDEYYIETARQAVDSCNWKVGECAAAWLKADKTRTDRDFSELIGLGRDRVKKCRLVWETFRGEGCATWHTQELSWSHHYAARLWPDAKNALKLAMEDGLTVAGMKRFWELQHGEPAPDEEADEEADEEEDEEEDDDVPETTSKRAPLQESDIDRSEPLAKPMSTTVPTPQSEKPEKPKTAEPYTPFKKTATVLDDNEGEPETTPEPPAKPTREMIEDFLNSLSLKDLCEAVRTIDGTDEEKAAALMELAYELDPSLQTDEKQYAITTKVKEKELDEQFEIWWPTYPRRKAKGRARRAFRTAAKRIGTGRLFEATEEYAKHCAEGLASGAIESEKFIPHPATWLNGECWDDESDSPVSGSGRTEQTIHGLEAWLRESSDDPTVSHEVSTVHSDGRKNLVG